MLPLVNLVKLDTRRSILRSFLRPQISYVLQLANRISVVAKCTFCELVVADFA